MQLLTVQEDHLKEYDTAIMRMTQDQGVFDMTVTIPRIEQGS